MNTLTDVRRALNSEIFKLRHSSIIVTVIVLPLVLTFTMNFLLPLLMGGSSPFPFTRNAWASAMAGMLQLWGFFQIFVVAIVTAQIGGLEHNNNTWKHLYALPVSRRAIYGAKVLVSLGLFGLSSLTLLGSVLVSGFLAGLLKPELGFVAAIPWGGLFTVLAINYLASWLMITIHAWAGVHWHSFAPAMGLSMVAFLINMFITGREDIQRIFPWTLPVNRPEVAVNSVALSLIASAIVVVFSGWRLAKRDVI
jgi:hypothetical protein